MANSSATTVDVLIAGAGPVGLFLANECARRGLKYRLVEERATQSVYSKALAIFPRTMEIFDMAGLAGPFLEKANRVTVLRVVAHKDNVLALLHFEPKESPYSFVAMVPQNVTEQLLAEALQRKSGIVEYQTKLVSAVQHDDRVVATIERNGGRQEVNASFLVGCDGSHSAVRHLLNLPFEGAEYADSFLLADIETNDAMPANELLLCPNEIGPLAVFPMSATRRRLVATINQPEGDTPSLELVRKIVAERAPDELEARSMHWGSYFRIHHRHVAQLRAGRMFIAGDAAHIHSPFGGQGMNTGLQDVWNLVWKLDLALHGRGNERLLESYSAERIPVIKSVIDTTDFMTKALGTANRLAQALRNAVIPMVSRLAPFQHAFVERLSELGIAYRGSPIVEGPGKRYFDESIRGGKGIGSRFLLVLGKDATDETMEAGKQMAQSLAGVLELRPSAAQSGITLVRPDGYIAYEEHTGEGVAALKSVQSILERQTSPETQARRV